MPQQLGARSVDGRRQLNSMRVQRDIGILVVVLVQTLGVALAQCPAPTSVVLFDDVRQVSRPEVYCAVVNDDEVTSTTDLASCSRQCADRNVCVGFNFKTSNLICEQFLTPYTSLSLTTGCTYYVV